MPPTFYHSGNSSDVCSTTSCVLAAASFLESMDETIDPCQDFYSFVCGNFIDKVNNSIKVVFKFSTAL